MSGDEIRAALADIGGELDPTLKHLKLASLVSAVFRERRIELVVVGGSAIEFYTEGAYVSGDVDMCLVPPSRVDLRTRQELMGLLGAKGGPRSWEVCGTYVDILGEVETLANTPLRSLKGPFGDVRVVPVEELIVERILVSRYPGDYPPALECAKKLIAAVLRDEVTANWPEVRRVAELPAYNVWPETEAAVNEQAKALKVRSPYDSDG
jgi:hypothetical protein